MTQTVRGVISRKKSEPVEVVDIVIPDPGPGEAVVDINGLLKKPMKGNCLCWYGNFEYCIKDLQDPSRKLLQKYNKRAKKYGNVNVGKEIVDKALQAWCRICGVKTDRVNNMWGQSIFMC